MGKRNAQKPTNDVEYVPLYLGAWLTFLGVKQTDLARDTGINEGYISELVAQKKRNPGFNLIARIVDSLGITIDQLRHPPPPEETVRAIQSLDPKLIDRIRRDIKKPRP